jgi:hypothetical protein
LPHPAGVSVGLSAMAVPVGALWSSMSVLLLALPTHAKSEPASLASAPPPLLELPDPLLLPLPLEDPVPPLELLELLEPPSEGVLGELLEQDAAHTATAAPETIASDTELSFLDMSVNLSTM